LIAVCGRQEEGAAAWSTWIAMEEALDRLGALIQKATAAAVASLLGAVSG